MTFLLVGIPLPECKGENHEKRETLRSRSRTLVVNSSGVGDYTHIQWAIDNASDGDTVYVEGGTYIENIVINKPIKLMGKGMDWTIIDGDGKGDVIRITANLVNVSGFTIKGGTSWNGSGIRIDSVGNCMIENNQCSYNNDGIYLHKSDNNVILNNYLNQNYGFGIYLYKTTSNNIINNTCNKNGNSGIFLDLSNMENCTNNSISGNTVYGIFLYNARYAVLSNNHLENNGIFIDGEAKNHWTTHKIDTSNTCNGNPIYYWKDMDSETVPSDAGQVILANCFYIKIENLKWNNCGLGIQLAFSSFNTIRNNICSYDTCDWRLIGISLYYSSNNIISGNTITKIHGGIYLSFSNNNEIYDNTCDLNYEAGMKFSYSYNNTIRDNICSDNDGTGIILDCSDENSVMNNSFCYNDYQGMLFDTSHNNAISSNTCNLNGDNGFCMVDSNNNNISKNFLNINKISGAYIWNSDFNEIADNTWNLNEYCGIYFRYSSYNYIMRNTLLDNDGFSILIIDQSERNIIYHNNFIDNDNSYRYQAKDEGNTNSWNISGEGNYWSDCNTPDENHDQIVDMSYSIGGGNGNIDYYPLAIPTNEIFPLVDAGDDIVLNQNETAFFNVICDRFRLLISNYTWKFTYNSTLQYLYGPTPVFTFGKPGVFLITLTIQNYFGDSTEDTVIVTVRDITDPIAMAGDNICVDQRQKVTFNAYNSTDNIGIINYTWTFDYNGIKYILYGKSPSFVFHEAGDYLVTLEVFDEEGNLDTDTVNVTVRDITPPTVNAGTDITINQSETVEFFFHQNSSDNVGVWDWTWTFYYDGIDQTLFHSMIMSSLPFFKFDIPGTYVVTMNVSDEAGNWAIDTLNIIILDSSPPMADGGGDTVIDQNGTVHFNASGSKDNTNIENYTWTFFYDGELVTLYGISPEFMFTKPGNYTITLTVYDSNRNKDLDTFEITVNPVQEPNEMDEPDDSLGPDNAGKETKSDIFMWAGILIAVFVIVSGGLLVIGLKKKEENLDNSENEFGRTGPGLIMSGSDEDEE